MAERTGTDDSGPPARPPTAASSPEGPRGPALPERVGPYEILGRLGAGGMGTVFLGRCGDGPPVAVKVLRPELARDPAFLRMFRHEVAAARRVVGFCTARVLDAEVSGPLPYLVTEYVDGVRLDRAVANSGNLSATDLEGLAVGMAAALTAIHGAGVVHRDLKPSNVLLSYFGPKVIDFGIARALDATTAATGRLMGTPAWMAPEQFAEGPATAAVDVFTWGSLVAYAGTGRRPFGQGAVVELAYRICHEPPDLEGLDGHLRELVEACMAKVPGQRPTARAVLLDLLGDHATPDPQTDATRLLERSWSPPPAAPRVEVASVNPLPGPQGQVAPWNAASPVQRTAAPWSGLSPAIQRPPAIRAAPLPRRRRAGWALALAGLVAGMVAVGLVAKLDGLPGSQGATPPPRTASVAGGQGQVAPPAGTPPLCDLLGDLDSPGALSSRPADQSFTAAAAAAGEWLPEPAALPLALEDHRFGGGCTRTWAEPAGPVVAALFQLPSRADALATRGQLRDALAGRGVRPDRIPEVTGGELYRLDAGGGSGQLVMFACNQRVLQIHAAGGAQNPDPLLVRLAQGANRRLHEQTGCPL
ncbi:MAG TPA: protein kinase [Actinomycetes bacterium]